MYLEQELVQGPLIRVKRARDGPRPGHVTAVPVVVATSVHQHQLPLLEHLRVGYVVDRVGPVAARDDRGIREVVGTAKLAPKLHLGPEVGLNSPRLGKVHHFCERLRGDFAGFLEQLDFCFRLD